MIKKTLAVTLITALSPFALHAAVITTSTDCLPAFIDPPNGNQQPQPLDREFSITTAEAGSCIGVGSGNINGSNQKDAYLIALGWEFLDASDTNGGLYDGWLTGSNLTSGTSGTFQIDPLAYTTYDRIAIGFKTGQGNYDPDWAIFELADNTLSGDWNITQNQALSHAILYGIGTPQTEVPEPATLALFGLGIAGLASARRRQR